MFKNAKVGDYVFSCTIGEGEVIAICQNKNRPVHVQFKFRDERVSYHVDGRRLRTDKYPEIYHRRFSPPMDAFCPPERPKYQWFYLNIEGKFCLTEKAYATTSEAEKDYGCLLIEPVLATKREK